MFKLAVLFTVLATVLALPQHELEARKKKTVTVTATATVTATVSNCFNNYVASSTFVTATAYGSGAAPSGGYSTTISECAAPTSAPFGGAPYCELFGVPTGSNDTEVTCRYNPGGAPYGPSWDGKSAPDPNIISGTGCATSTVTVPSTAVGCFITTFPATATASSSAYITSSPGLASSSAYITSDPGLTASSASTYSAGAASTSA